MEKNKIKTSIFATLALLITLGFIVAGFAWLHFAAGKSQLHLQTKAILSQDINNLKTQLNQQQQIVLDLQARVHKLEMFDVHIKHLQQAQN